MLACDTSHAHAAERREAPGTLLGGHRDDDVLLTEHPAVGDVQHRSCARARASLCRGVDVAVAVGVCQRQRYAGGVDEAAAATVGLGPGGQTVRATCRCRVFCDGVVGSPEEGVGAGSWLILLRRRGLAGWLVRSVICRNVVFGKLLSHVLNCNLVEYVP